MNISRLGSLLKQQAAMSSLLGAKQSDVDSILEFVQFLQKYERLTLEQFCIFYDAEPRTKKSITRDGDRKLKNQPGVSPELLKDYVEQLQANEASVGEVLDRLKADKQLGLADLKKIATLLEGTDSNYKSKSKAVAAISAWVQHMVDNKRRLQGVSGIF